MWSTNSMATEVGMPNPLELTPGPGLNTWQGCGSQCVLPYWVSILLWSDFVNPSFFPWEEDHLLHTTAHQKHATHFLVFRSYLRLMLSLSNLVVACKQSWNWEGCGGLNVFES